MVWLPGDGEMANNNFLMDFYGMSPRRNALDAIRTQAQPGPSNYLLNNNTGAAYYFNSSPMAAQTEAADYANPIDVLGKKGYRLKSDPMTVVFGDGTRARLGANTAEEAAANAAKLKAWRDAQEFGMKQSEFDQNTVKRDLENKKAAQELGPDAKLNESQANATGYGMRASNSHEILNSLGAEGVSQPGMIKRAAETLPLIGDSAGAALNWTQSPQQQQVEQAQRDYVNALLRRESGAAISPTEFENARRQYFPQPGDSPEVIAQKRKNRELSIEALRAGSGQGAQRIDTTRMRTKLVLDAKSAISKGAPRDKVVAELASMGITDHGL